MTSQVAADQLAFSYSGTLLADSGISAQRIGTAHASASIQWNDVVHFTVDSPTAYSMQYFATNALFFSFPDVSPYGIENISLLDGSSTLASDSGADYPRG